MEITLIDNVSKSELADIKKMIGEAFITNELFHEFGDINDRKELVMKYMDIYTDYVYESKALYGTENHKGIVGFVHSKKAPVYPQLKMLIRLLKVIPYKTLKKYMSHVKQLADSNKQYATKPHIDILFVIFLGVMLGADYIYKKKDTRYYLIFTIPLVVYMLGYMVWIVKVGI